MIFLDFENHPKNAGQREWGNFDEEHFLKLTEEYAGLEREMNKETLNEYFDQFIR